MAKKKTKAQKRQQRNARNMNHRNVAKLKQQNKQNNVAISSCDLAGRPSGLRNDGNTCFYNSTMQCLSQTYTLGHLLNERNDPEYEWEAYGVYQKEKEKSFTTEKVQLKLKESRPSITCQFVKLVNDVCSTKTTTPSALLNEIRQKRTQFRGYSQHDAQELLISLLDCLKEAEVDIQKRALLGHLKFSKPPTEKDRQRAQQFKYAASHSPLDAVFGGQLLSWVRCMDCGFCSFGFERFFDLQVSVPHSNVHYTNGKNANSDSKESVNEASGDESDAPHEDVPAKLSRADKKKKRQEKKAAKRMARQKALNNDKKVEKEEDDEEEEGGDEEEEEAKNVEDKSEEEEEEEDSDAEECSMIVIEKDKKKTTTTAEDCETMSMEPVSAASKKEFEKLVLQKLSYNPDDFDNKELGELLKHYISEDVLKGDNRYLCDGCTAKNGGKKSYSMKAIKSQMIALPPQTLVIQLKRFESMGYTRKGMRNMSKLSTPVSFPLRLNLSPYTSRIYECLAGFYEPNYNLLSSERILDYELYAMVLHSGGLSSGHYYAYVRVRGDRFQEKENNKFLHLKPFIPNIDHILALWYNKANGKATTNGHSNHHSQPESESDQSEPDEEDTDEDEEEDVSESHLKTKNNGAQSMWFQISDSSVSSITEENVLQNSSNQYLLFYERCT